LPKWPVCIQGTLCIIRDAAPGVPVPKALLGIEKIILEKKPTALLIGPFRSEALLAAMDIVFKHKVPQYIEFRDMLPKSKVGKLLRREIRDEEKRRAEG
jgi:hypothetical protein